MLGRTPALDPRALRLEVREHDLARDAETTRAARSRTCCDDARRALADRRLRHGRLVAAPAAPLPGRRGEDLRAAGERHGPRRRLVRDRQGDRRARAQPRARGDRGGRRDRAGSSTTCACWAASSPRASTSPRRWRRGTRAPCSRRARWSASLRAAGAGRRRWSRSSRVKRPSRRGLLVADLAALLELARAGLLGEACRRGPRTCRRTCRARAPRSARDRRRRARASSRAPGAARPPRAGARPPSGPCRALRSACSASRSRVLGVLAVLGRRPLHGAARARARASAVQPCASCAGAGTAARPR